LSGKVVIFGSRRPISGQRRIVAVTQNHDSDKPIRKLATTVLKWRFKRLVAEKITSQTVMSQTQKKTWDCSIATAISGL